MRPRDIRDRTLPDLDHLGRKILASMLPKQLWEPLQAGHGGADAAPPARTAENPWRECVHGPVLSVSNVQ